MTAQPHRDLRRRVVAGARSQVLVTIALLVASFASQVGMARHFSFVGLGEYVGTVLVIFLVSVVAISGLPLAAAERVGRALENGDPEAARRAASTGFVLAMLASAAAALVLRWIWEPVMGAMRVPRPVDSSLAALGLLGASAVGYVPLVFQARLQMAAVGLLAICQPFTVLLLTVWDVIHGGVAPVFMAVIGYVVAGIVSSAALLLVTRATPPARSEVRPLLRQALLSLPLLWANVFSSWIDRLLTSLLLGPAALGIYQADIALIDGALRIPRASTTYLVSAYARVSVATDGSIGRALAVHVRLWTAYAAGIGALLIAGSDGIATTVFGGGSIAAALPLRVLALGLVPGVVVLSYATATAGSGFANVGVVVGRATIPIAILLLVVLAPTFGVVGAAVAQVAGITAMAIGYSWWSARHHFAFAPARLVRPLSIAAGVLVLGIGVSAVPAAWYARCGAAAVLTAALVVPSLIHRDERLVIRTLLLGQ